MKIGIDARPLIGPRTGIANYLLGLFEALAHKDRRHEFVLYAPRPLDFRLPNPRWQLRIVRGFKGTNGTLWLQYYGRHLAEKDRVDLFWGAHFLLPICLKKHVPAVATVYDLVPFLFPQTMELRNYLALRTLLRPSLTRAQHVTVISRSVAADLHRLLKIPDQKITVIPPGVGAQFLPRDPSEARRYVARALGLEKHYLLAVGTVEPRKNLVTLLRAFAALPEAVRNRWMLVVAGAGGWKTSSIYAAAAPLVAESTVRFFGYVPDEDLPWLYAGATLFVHPSLYEGFGIPVVEAMTCGVPVLASDITVLREVAGEAATYLPPLDAAAWSKAIATALEDDAYRNLMRERGLRQALQYSYHQSAARLLDILERLAEGIEIAAQPVVSRPH